MKLVLAEKPSVAQSIAKVLGAAKREDGYLEGNGFRILYHQFTSEMVKHFSDILLCIFMAL